MGWLWVTIGAFLFVVTISGVVARIFENYNAQYGFLIVGVVVGLGLVGYLMARYGVSVEFLAATFFYMVVCEFYLFMLSVVTTSISANVILLVGKQPISREALGEKYNEKKMVELRIARLTQDGLVRQTGHGHYFLTSKGQRICRVTKNLSLFFHHVGATND